MIKILELQLKRSGKFEMKVDVDVAECTGFFYN
jgi:hypothetical protein